MTLKTKILPVTALRQNCSIIWCDETNHGAIVDPGGDVEKIISAVEEINMTPKLVLITHAHMDHAGGAAATAEHFAVPIEGPHIDDKFLVDALPHQGKMYDLPGCRVYEPQRWLQAGDSIKFGNIVLDVLHCPGHTPGHVVFYDKTTDMAFVGDVIFKGSIGRTDFIMGNHEDLIHSIRETLFPLGENVTFVPGHGPTSTFGEERKNNPYVGDDVVG
ncbi:MAG: MBL fold metallo-hydrolase [Rhodospirillaceae bacterium]|nr:MBL fold metallo-hydrolase [Rhodospirillaceae bacterium]